MFKPLHEEAQRELFNAGIEWLRTMTVEESILAGYVDPDAGLTQRAEEFLTKFLPVSPNGRRFDFATMDDICAAIARIKTSLSRHGEALFRR